MLKYYFKTALRVFTRNKAFALINVLGLSVGISAALVIFLIVHYEFSFDRFEKDADRIYRIVLDARFNDADGHSAAVPAPLSGAVEREVTGIDATVPVMQFQGDATTQVTVETPAGKPRIYKKQSDVVFTNSGYFKLLPFQWIAGSPATAMKDPFTVVLTESRSRRYFPGMAARDVVGRRLTCNDITLTVSGIVKDLHEHTAFTAEAFISYSTIAQTSLKDQFMMDVWNDWMIYSQLYVKIAEGSTPGNVETQLKTLLSKYNKDVNKDRYHTMSFRLQPLNDIHFNPWYPTLGSRIVHKPTLYGLLAIAAFLLLLGSINFINLTTAYASQRAREIGIRKTMGSSKANLIVQFLGETVLITTLAALVSVALTPLLLRMFRDFIPPGLHFDLLHQSSLIIFLLLLIVAVSFLSGLYPAFVLSGYRPARVLKNQAFADKAQTRNAWVRKTLTVSQFVIAQFFVMATLMVGKQIRFSLNTDMGFNKEAVINFNIPRDTVAGREKLLLNEIASIPGVALASTGFFAPADKGVAFVNIAYHTGKEEIKPNAQIRWGDSNYLKLYQIKIIAGRNVLPEEGVKEFLVNESFAHAIGFTKAGDAVGRELQWNGKNVPIVGIMKDFHDQSTHARISPMVFEHNNGSTFHVKLAPDNAGGAQWTAVIAGIRKQYKQLYPDEEFNYGFLDDTIAAFYEREQQTARLLGWATALAILISCLGLLGLVIYTTGLRSKEIGIRKVLGATVSQIVTVLSKDFLRLVLIAFVLAAPVAWWAIHRWLEDYSYRTSLSWWVFALSGLGMMLIALVTMGLQTVRAATANPVKSLRTE
ncbi:ABC transporter permease [Compostibacter hankyongensis]|uniref:ABC transporter permease n=1 Tax=Compostibacter hankyongensis TaxID=1007089 RepID=A0ABP8FC64_9BACT